jgi:branched-chain amino acid transport system ATP-binding protein
MARPEGLLTLSVRDLAVSFGGVAALAGVSFDVHGGRITSMIGPNGAGKTTAFNAITGYLSPTRGRIEYDGVPLTGLRPSAVAARGIVRTFQRTSVFPSLSVADNVMIGLHLRGSAGFLDVMLGNRRLRAEESRLAHDADALIEFVGLGHRRGETASGLPYGEQRLVELAVALGARPRLLLLDEPGAGMTTAEKATVSDLIRRIRDAGATVLLVEHDMRMVMSISDTVLVLNHGRLIAEGPPAAIQAHPDVIRAYLGSAGDRA